MNLEIVGLSFTLGLSASLGCLGVCMPVLTPFIVAESESVKAGFITFVVFSIGRLIVYSILGVICFWVGINYLLNNAMLQKGLDLSLAIILIVYGLSLILLKAKKYHCTFRSNKSIIAILLGMLIGSISCPALWLAIFIGVKTTQITNVFLSTIIFGLTSSFLILLLGVVAAKIGNYYRLKLNSTRLKVICGLTLIISGIFYLFYGGKF